MSIDEITKCRAELDSIAVSASRRFENQVADAIGHLQKVRNDLAKKYSDLQVECSKTIGHEKCLIGGCSVCGWAGSPA